MHLSPWLCWTTVHRFREVISTSQQSKSMRSRVIKSPCGFLGIIFLLLVSLTLFVCLFLSSLALSFPSSFYLFIFSHHRSFSLSLSFLHPLCCLTSAPSHSQSAFLDFFLPFLLCYPHFSGYDKAFFSALSVYITDRMGSGITTHSSQFYS